MNFYDRKKLKLIIKQALDDSRNGRTFLSKTAKESRKFLESL